MKGDEFEKDEESRGDVILNSYIDMSPLQHGMTLMGTGKVADILAAAGIFGGILCSFEDEDGNKKYYISKKDDDKKPNAENLYDIFDEVDKVEGATKLTMSFSVEEGFHGEVGGFEIDSPREDAHNARLALEHEQKRLALALAQKALIPILGKLGEEGLLEPRRKMGIAGEVATMKGNIDKNAHTYNIMRKEFDSILDEEMREHKKEVEELKEKINELSK